MKYKDKLLLNTLESRSNLPKLSYLRNSDSFMNVTIEFTTQHFCNLDLKNNIKVATISI